MEIRLLSRADVLNVMSKRVSSDDLGYLLLCTVIEPIQLAEGVQKGQERMAWPEFLDGLKKLSGIGQLCIEPLDMGCLSRALFDRFDTTNVVGLWREIRSAEMTPVHTVHRLILRPSEETFWPDDLYDRMEEWHVEEWPRG